MKLNRRIFDQIRDLSLARGIHLSPVCPEGASPYFYTGYATSIFSIEFFFDTIMLGHFGNTSLAENTLKHLLLAHRQEDGFIPRRVVTNPLESQGNVFHHFERDEHCQPVLFQSALLIARRKGNADWITPGMYDTLTAYLDHWNKYWDRDHNGLCEWASAPHGCSDTAMERAGIWRSYFCEGVDLNCQRYLEYCAAEKIAQALHRKADAVSFHEQAGKIADLVRTELWDEADGFFYDRDIRTQKPIRLKHCHCFHVLESGIATKEQADRIIQGHLLNPGEFWSAYPLPSYAMDEPAYTQHHKLPPGENPMYYLPDGHCNWRGGMWPHTAYSCAHGLNSYGYAKEASHIAEKLTELVDRYQYLYEWYNAETGEGMGAHPFFAGCEGLMAFLQTELETGFNPYRIEDVDKKLDSGPLVRSLGINVIPDDII